MRTGLTSIPYGSTYSLNTHPEENWDHDLTLMAHAGMNLIRMGDVGLWERVEASEGEIKLDLIERFYKKAHEHGLHILLGTGSCSPPLWLAHQYPETRILSSRGERYPLGTSYHWACLHHPGYLASCERYITALAQMAITQPNHYGWQISNEIGFPFNPTREREEIDLYCYCDHSKQNFASWLQQKYGTVEALTEAWTWATTNFVYTRWEDAFPPEALPHSWSSMTRWIDWRLFWQDAFAEHAGWQHQLIRKFDQHHPTSVNTFNFKGYDRFGTYTGLDQWKIASQVDHIGYDLYPGSGNKRATRPEHNSIFLDHGRSVAQYAGSDYWLPEIESGPIGGWLLGPDHHTQAKDIYHLCFESLGHNVKLLVFMPWKEWDFMALHWGALVDLESNPTPRYQAATEIGQYLAANADFLKEAQVPKGEIAILESKSNAIFLRGVGGEEELFEAQRGAYRAFWDSGYNVDFITPEQLQHEGINDYHVICLPLLGILSEETALALQDYVLAGGVLVGFSRTGTLDERGWVHRSLPMHTLGEIFGLDHIDPATLNGQSIVFADQQYLGWMNRDLLKPKEGTEILGRFSDGHPAITMAKHGKGLGIYIATQADIGALQEGAALLPALVETLTTTKGFIKQVHVDYPGRTWRAIDPHLLDTDERTEILIVSYLEGSQEIKVQLNEAERRVEKIYRGVNDKSDLKYRQTESTIEFELEIGAESVECIQIRWLDT